VDARGADESAVHRRRAQPAFFRSLDGVAPLDAGAAADRGEARNGPRIQAVPGQPGGGHRPSRSGVRGRNHGDAKDRRLRGAVPHSGGAAQRRVAGADVCQRAFRRVHPELLPLGKPARATRPVHRGNGRGQPARRAREGVHRAGPGAGRRLRGVRAGHESLDHPAKTRTFTNSF